MSPFFIFHFPLQFLYVQILMITFYKMYNSFLNFDYQDIYIPFHQFSLCSSQ